MQHFAERHELDLRIDVLLVDLKEEDKGLITGEEQGGGRRGWVGGALPSYKTLKLTSSVKRSSPSS